MNSIEWLIEQLYNKMDMSGNGRVLDKILEEAKEMNKKEIIEELIGFQIFLNNKALITNHDWDYEKWAKKYIKSIKK